MKKVLLFVVLCCGMTAQSQSNNALHFDGSENKFNKPEEIDVASLEEICDFVDAMEAIVDEVLAIKKSVDGDASKLSEADLERGQALAEKMNELGKAAYEKFGDEEPDCPNKFALENKLREL